MEVHRAHQGIGAAVGRFKMPFAHLLRVSERSSFISEELGFDEVFRDRPTVDGYEGTFSARTGAVYCPRKKLFSGS